jgi:pyruvate/2-oxoglutarate dehydrogenase complex dihydrolipoamide acyltransferase (E2) component
MTEDQGDRSGRAATARAEELVDRMGESVGHLASLAGWRILRAAAFVREEAEDVWAEAQSVRHAHSVRSARQEERYAGPVSAAEPIEATDVARRTAEDLNVDLREVTGTGVHGRITVGDVKRKSKEGA